MHAAVSCAESLPLVRRSIRLSCNSISTLPCARMLHRQGPDCIGGRHLSQRIKVARSSRGMNKEYVSYGIIGVVAGLVLGFIVANWVGSSANEGPQAATSTAGANPTSVNSSNSGQAVTPGHPPSDSGQTI